MEALALTADQVAELMQYLHRDGTGNAELIRSMYRAGEFLGPIDSSQPVTRWRWYRPTVEMYMSGRWNVVARAMRLDLVDGVAS